MDKQNVFVPSQDRANFQSLTIEYSNMKNWLTERQSRKDEDIQQYTVMLDASIKMLHEDRKVASNAANDEMFLEYTPTGMNDDSGNTSTFHSVCNCVLSTLTDGVYLCRGNEAFS